MANLPQVDASSLVADRDPQPMADPGTEAAPLVLHLDDDAAMRASVRMLIRSAGLRVISAGTSTEALQRVRDEQLAPDVLILDFHLPGEMTGADVAEALARIIGHAPPTIMLTGDTPNAELPWIVGAPVWMLGKPFNPQVLMAGVEALARFHRLTHFERH